MLQLREFDRKLLRAVESEMAGDQADSEKDQPTGMIKTTLNLDICLNMVP